METPSKILRNLHLSNVQENLTPSRIHNLTPLKIPASPFMKDLGFGTCVKVYKLERLTKQGKQPLSPWAVKKVKRTNAEVSTDIFNERIHKEAAILRKLRHPNIVGFRGLTKSADGMETLVLECLQASLGSILEERFENEFGPLAPEHTIKMITDIASALDYLHTEAKILHGDLKSFNILVKEEFEICKLCDFGVSLPLDENGLIDIKKNPTLRYVGTNLWSAPEVLDDSDVLDCKADVFSFGLIIYETIALVPPHTIGFNNTINDENNPNDKSDESLDEMLEETDIACGTRPPLPSTFELTEDYNKIVEIFYHCTAQLAEDRPNAKTILEAFTAKQEN